jgi:hypothetical protein
MTTALAANGAKGTLDFDARRARFGGRRRADKCYDRVEIIDINI